MEYSSSCVNLPDVIFSDGQDGELNTAQTLILQQCMKRVQETLMHLSSDHRDLHGSVSKVGKAIDRVSTVTVYVAKLTNVDLVVQCGTCVHCLSQIYVSQ